MGCKGSKAAAAPAPAAATASAVPEGDYKVTLEKMGDADVMGLTIVDQADNTILVHALKEEGLALAFNKTQENVPENQINAGDVIVAVNAVFGDIAAMKTELKQKTVTLTMKRKSAAAAAEEKATPPAAPALEGPEPEPAVESAAEPVVSSEEAASGEAPAAAQIDAIAAREPTGDEAVVVAEPAPATEEPTEDVQVVQKEPALEDQLVPFVEEPLELRPEAGTKCGVCC